MRPIANLPYEEAVLGAVFLLGTPAVEVLTVDVGLRPEHFYSPKWRAVFAAALAVADAGDPVDAATVATWLQNRAQLDGVVDRNALDALTSAAPVAGNYVTYARDVKQDALWRARRRALIAADAAIARRDEEAFAQLEGMLTVDPEAADVTWDAETIRSEVFDYLAGNGSRPLPLPYPKLNDLLGGGVDRGDVTFVSGWTSMGKSTMLDGLLEWFASGYFAQEHNGGRPLRVHLYMNEMALIMRALRLTASVAEVPFKRLKGRRLTPAETRSVLRQLNAMSPFSLTNCSGWSVDRIGRHIKAKRWDIVGIDSMSLIPRANREELDRISSQICSIAQQVDCHIFEIGLLSKARADAILPPPAESDIRDSSKIPYDVANLMFVHRDQREETALVAGGREVPTGRVKKLLTGTIDVTKARNGEQGTTYIRLNPARMRFEELRDQEVVAA